MNQRTTYLWWGVLLVMLTASLHTATAQPTTSFDETLYEGRSGPCFGPIDGDGKSCRKRQGPW